jgi:DNA modification methylase
LLFKLITYYSQRDDILLDLITWGKTNPMPLSNNHFLNDTEYCLCIHEKGVGWNVKAGANVKRKCYMTPVNKEDRENYDFPCCKPTSIIENFIINSSKEGDVIFDPFVGSASSMISAKRLKRKYLGFEIDEKTFEMANRRLQGENAKGELNLFDVEY